MNDREHDGLPEVLAAEIRRLDPQHTAPDTWGQLLAGVVDAWIDQRRASI